MQSHIGLVKNTLAGILLTISLTGFIIASGYKYMQKKFQKKTRDEKDISLVKQTREQFERLLSQHLTFPIAMGY